MLPPLNKHDVYDYVSHVLIDRTKKFCVGFFCLVISFLPSTYPSVFDIERNLLDVLIVMRVLAIGSQFHFQYVLLFLFTLFSLRDSLLVRQMIWFYISSISTYLGFSCFNTWPSSKDVFRSHPPTTRELRWPFLIYIWAKGGSVGGSPGVVCRHGTDSDLNLVN